MKKRQMLGPAEKEIAANEKTLKDSKRNWTPA